LQCDPRKVRLSEPPKVELYLAQVAPKEIGSIDPAPYMTGGKTIKQAQLEFLQARLGGAQEEFLKVPKKKSNPSFEVAEQHTEKNRYRDIHPYDDNVVRLRSSSDGTSYINASYVTFPALSSRNKAYYFICTQGPTSATVDDQWYVAVEMDRRPRLGLPSPLCHAFKLAGFVSVVFLNSSCGAQSLSLSLSYIPPNP
jgi:hypothetical protein